MQVSMETRAVRKAPNVFVLPALRRLLYNAARVAEVLSDLF